MFTARRGLAAAALLAGAIAASAPAHAQSRVDVGMTPGGCVQLCQDVPFCKDYDIDLKAARCTLVLDDAGAKAAGLFRRCPEGEEERIEPRRGETFTLMSSCIPRR